MHNYFPQNFALVMRAATLIQKCTSTLQIAHTIILKLLGILWNRTLVEYADKLSSTAVDFIRSEKELENMHLHGA